MPACITCPVCDQPGTFQGSNDVRSVPCNVRHFMDEPFTMWRCNNCRSIHCAEEADLAHYYAHYPIKKQKLDFHERAGYRNRLRLIQRQGLKHSDRILDYGCGPGLFVEFLRENGFVNACGYDPFEPQFSDPRILENPADVVVSYDVIEHDESPQNFMRTLAALVRPGGLLVIGTPNADFVELSRVRSPSLHAPYHRHILSEKVLVALGREQNLSVEEVLLRSYFDTLIPTVNARFMWRYVESGKYLDVAFEPPRTRAVLTSPVLIFLAFSGYFFPSGDWMTVSFRKPA